MTPEPLPQTTSTDMTGLAVAMGRVEEKLNAMSEKENKTGERLDKIDERLTKLELNIATNVRPKTPWYLWVGGVGALLLLGLNGFALIELLVNLATVAPPDVPPVP